MGEIENYWLVVCIVSALLHGCCLSVAKLFNSDIITAFLKYLYCFEGAVWRRELCADTIFCASVCTVSLPLSLKKQSYRELKRGSF